ncbi:hypothetical protein [Treponema endosymbiont of Eucomonympha sp.]|uniref:hypothetical protein n=1 Tax=Treponema endosymbiont of Eucomonympha sp. TaxID=1580831 RepID=UPI000B1982BD|nr:hypothetical protein [Treponema endosymbiont of Eucomonympha sp.]
MRVRNGAVKGIILSAAVLLNAALVGCNNVAREIRADGAASVENAGLRAAKGDKHFPGKGHRDFALALRTFDVTFAAQSDKAFEVTANDVLQRDGVWVFVFDLNDKNPDVAKATEAHESFLKLLESVGVPTLEAKEPRGNNKAFKGAVAVASEHIASVERKLSEEEKAHLSNLNTYDVTFAAQNETVYPVVASFAGNPHGKDWMFAFNLSENNPRAAEATEAYDSFLKLLESVGVPTLETKEPRGHNKAFKGVVLVVREYIASVTKQAVLSAAE